MPSKKDNLLAYLNTANLDLSNPRFMSQEEIDASDSSYLIEKDYDKYKDYLSKGNTKVVHDSPETWDDKRARQQSNLAKIGNSVGQGVGTFLTATASTIAAIPSIGAGLLAEGADMFMEGDQVSGMDIALNNPIMKGIGDLDKYIKEEIVPTYYTKEQQESLLSASTGTDLLNGVGFLLSNIIPSSLATKGLSFLPKLATAAKAGKLESTLQTAIGKGLLKAEDASQLNLLGKFFEKAPAMTGALVGRLGESAMEANGVYESITQQLNAENQEAQQELETYGTTNKKIRTPEEIELAAKNGQSDAFYGNMVLSISDLGQQTRWLKPTGLGDDIVKKGLGYAVKKRTKSELIGDFMKESLQEAGEEGFQFLVQKGAEKSATKGTSFIGEAIDSSGDLFGTIEGQKSMLLGAVLGGGASAIANKRNAPEKAIRLQQMVNDLNSNAGVVTDKYTETPDGKRILNPAFAKQSQTFLKLEELRTEALEQGDIETAQLIEKQQFTNLVQSRVENEKFDDLIDELEALGKADDAELIQYLGQVPTDAEGNKLTASQVSVAKIQEAKQIKKMIDNLNTIPQYKSLSPSAKNDFNNHILTQDNLLKSIQQLDGKIASLEATKSFIIPETVGTTTKVQETLDPVTAEEVKNLKETRAELATKYETINESIKQALKDPSKLENKIAEKAKQELDNLTNEIEAQDNILTETESKLTELKTKAEIEPVVINTPMGEIEVSVVDGQFVDAVTGEVVNEEDVRQSIQQEITENKAKEKEDFTDEEEYKETEGPIANSAKKPTVYSTSTKGYAGTGTNRVTTFYNNPSNEVAYQKESLFYNIVKWFGNWANTPGLTKNKYITRLFLQTPTQEILDRVNASRKAKQLEELTMEDLTSNPGYVLIGMNVLENGKSVSEDILHFHDVDYFTETLAYENLKKQYDNGEIDEAKFYDEIAKERELIVKQRLKLITALKSGKDVQLEVVTKSNGIINYNPKVDGKNQVLPIFSLGKLGGEIFKLDKDGKPLVYSNGLGVIIAEDEETYTVRYEGNKEGKQGYESTISKKDFKGYVGQTVFGTVTANGTPYLTRTTQREFSDENLDSMTSLILHRLNTDENTFKVGNQEFTIVGKDENRGIIDSLIVWGFRKNEKEKQIGFNDDGSLQVGNRKIQPNDPNAKTDIERLLKVYKNYPSFTAGTLGSKITFPTEIVDGKAEADIQTIDKFLFGGDAPLIGTNINSEVPFINSYFTFKTDGGDLKIITDEEVEVETPYMDDLDATFGEAPKPSDFGEAETVGELTDEGEIKPITTAPVSDVEAKKADIERRRQEELNKNRLAFDKASNKEELTKAVKDWVGKDPYDTGFVFLNVRAALTSPGGFKKGKEMLYENHIKSLEKFVNDRINAKYDAELAVLEGAKSTETKPVTVELNKAVEENDKACTTNNPAKEGKPATLNNKKFTDTDNNDWD